MTNMNDHIRRGKDGRWNKGHSGNPRGRPKGAKKHWTKISAMVREPVSVRRADGSTEHLHMLEVSFLAMCNRALKGEKKALFKALEIMTELTPPDPRVPNQTNSSLHRKLMNKIRATFPEIDAPENKHRSIASVVALALYREEVEAELDAQGKGASDGWT